MAAETAAPAVHAAFCPPRSPRRFDRARDVSASASSTWFVNLYPFVRAPRIPATPFEALVEEIDIGGPSLVRAAAQISAVCSSSSTPTTTRACSRRSMRAPAWRFDSS